MHAMASNDPSEWAGPYDRRSDDAGQPDDLGQDRRSAADPETDLVTRLRDGDEAAFDTVYATHAASLVRFAYSYVGSVVAAEDVVADTFVHLWERRATLTSRFGIKAYLFAAVHNRVRHVLRSRQRYGRAVDRLIDDVVLDQPTVEATLDADALDVKLRRAIAGLPPDRRRLVALRWFDELTVPEIADVLQLSAGAVKQRLLRTLETLRTLLDG